MQVAAWSAPVGVLGELVASARVRAEALRARAAELERSAADAAVVPSFTAALRSPTVALVCEIKRRSPSRGAIAESLDPVAHARAYAAGGAAALSVLTEPERFGGSEADLLSVRNAVPLPILRKDFLVHPLQLVEARALGASAVLLIARALPPEELRSLAALARELGLDALVEVREERELDTALASGAPAIGVNTRNLETLEVDPTVAERLVPTIPSDRVGIFESGIATRADVERAAATGADAVLVGSSISGAPDPRAAVTALAGVPSRPRGAGR